MAKVDLQSLVEDVQIGSVTFFEIGAIRSDGDNLVDPASDEVSPSYNLQTAHRDDDKGFRVRVRTEVDSSIGKIVVDVSVDFELESLIASQIKEPTMIDFVNGVAIMVLLPYIRQSIADISQRVFGAALTMPIFKRGEVEFASPKT